MSLKIEMQVEMEGGATHHIVVDQRDLAKLEVAEVKGKYTGIRHLAWTAMTRQQLTSLTWPEFQDACIEASDPDEDEQEPDVESDPPISIPGLKEAGTGSSSASPALPASRSRK